MANRRPGVTYLTNKKQDNEDSSWLGKANKFCQFYNWTQKVRKRLTRDNLKRREILSSPFHPILDSFLRPAKRFNGPRGSEATSQARHRPLQRAAQASRGQIVGSADRLGQFGFLFYFYGWLRIDISNRLKASHFITTSLFRLTTSYSPWNSSALYILGTEGYKQKSVLDQGSIRSSTGYGL